MELAQASRKRMTVIMFRIMNTLRVSIRKMDMTYPKLQFFFVRSPFQNLFFLVGKKAIPLLIDLVQDLIDPLLGNIGDLFKRLSTGYFIIELIFGRPALLFSIGIEQVVAPV